MILVVDDDPVFLEQAKVQLAGVSKRGVFFAGDAKQALTLIDELGTDFSLALIDLNLPGTSGFELMLEIRKSPQDVPVIAISGVANPKILESAKAFGAIDVLSKPITGAWHDAINQVLNSRRQKLATKS